MSEKWLTTYNGFDSFMSEMLNNFWNHTNNFETSLSNYPKLDSYLTENTYCIETDVPGIPKENIILEITEDNYLRIAGDYPKRKEIKTQIKELYLRKFERFVKLP